MRTLPVNQLWAQRPLLKIALATVLSSLTAAAIWCSEEKTPSAVALAQLDPNALPIDLDRGAAGLQRCLVQLSTRASLLMVTAHPDDEDGGMLAYQSRYVGARTALLTLNRGEGGQNAMSTDFYDALGLVRTQELLQADRFYGVDQYWGTVIDYGFSKTREEALEQWGYERVLSDTVRVIRMTRPLVITSVFAGAPTDGHGNHQVAGQMAQEVFDAAADPNRFPEQLRSGLRPWKAAKMYARVPFFAPTKNKTIYDYATDKYVPIRFFDYVHKQWINETPATDVTIAEGTLNPAAGLTFGQMARQGWGYQKSQNGGATIPLPSLYAAPYHRYASRVETGRTEKSFYDGIDTSLPGLVTLSTGGDTAFLKQGLSRLADCVHRALDQYRPAEPSGILDFLAEGLKLDRELLEKTRASSLAEPGKSDIVFELERKAEQFERALTFALGLSFQAVVAPEKESSGPFSGTPTTFTIAIPGQHFSVQSHLINGGVKPVHIASLRVLAADGKKWEIHADSNSPVDLAPATENKRKFSIVAPADATPVKAYFERSSQEQPYYDLTDERFRNLSLAPYPLSASARVSFQGLEWDVWKVVQASSRIDSVGIVQNPLLIEPALSLSIARAAGAIPIGTASFNFACSVHSNVKGAAQGTVKLQLPAGWRATPASQPFSLARDGEHQTFNFQVEPGPLEQKRYELRATADYKGTTYSEGYRMVGYPGVRPYPFYRKATYQATGVDVHTAPDLHVGFLPGTGDEVPAALGDLGVRTTVLAGSDLESRDLSEFQAIVLGVRAYSVRPELRAFNSYLLNYVKKGGVLIVQYNLQNLDDGYAPYMVSLGSNPQKVVDENSKIQILAPGAPLLNWPNRISAADFAGWEEERGHGFMEKWDPHYQALIETHDPDQPAQRGGLLVAPYGKGFYIYEAFALYRQLPSGVSGAYRILANLVSLGKNPSVTKAR